MNCRIEMGSILALAAIGFATGAGGAERAVDVNEFARCAGISSANERVQCYDALAAVAIPGLRRAGSPVQPPAASAQAASVSQPALAAQPGPSVPSVSSGATSAPLASVNPDDPANFGLNPRQVKMAPKGPDAIKAVVSTLTEDRLNHIYLVLDNEQTWNLLDPDPHVRPGDSVTIKRAALGSFLMTTPSRRSYRVERVK